MLLETIGTSMTAPTTTGDRMSALRIILVFGLVAAAAVAAELAVAARSSGVSMPLGMAGDGVPSANFTSTCRFSHSNNDDLIRFPGRPGLSHNHTYFGNASTNAFSTLASLRRAGTTCARHADRAAYWAPTLLDAANRPVYPRDASIYYVRATIKSVVPFPRGLRMIAGSAHAMTPQGHVAWSCGPAGGRPASHTIPTCANRAGTYLQLTVTFPKCWNGRDLDSPDHKSHLAYSGTGLCPSSHPIAVPSMSVTIRYPVRGGPGFHLASGGPYTAHADFVNVWNQRELVRLVRNCLNAGRLCGPRE